MRHLALILALATACGGGTTPAAEPSAPASPPQNVTGLISEVRFEGEEVVSFVVEAREDSYDLLIDPEYDYGFNLRHLEKHRVDELPIFVEISVQEGKLYAHEVLDA